MKICITGELLGNRPFTGVENYAYQLIRTLSESTADDLWVLGPPGLDPGLFNPNVNLLVHKPLKYPGRYSLSAVLMPPRCLHEFDIVHCPTVAAPFFFRPRAKVVMTVHDLIPILHPRWHILRRRLYFNCFLRYRIRFVDHLIAVSANTKRDLVRCFNIAPEKISVSYNGVSKHFRPGTGKKKKCILAVGTIEPRKNLRRVIQAFVLLKKKHNLPHKLMIAGAPGWYCQEELKLVEKHRACIELLGYVPDEDLPALYRQAACLVYPSLYEGFGLPVIEAMACGCPVIASDRSSLPEIAGDAALQVNPYDIGELADAILRVAMDASLREKMSALGLKKSAEFSWQRCAERTLQIYDKVLSN